MRGAALIGMANPPPTSGSVPFTLSPGTRFGSYEILQRRCAGAAWVKFTVPRTPASTSGGRSQDPLSDRCTQGTVVLPSRLYRKLTRLRADHPEHRLMKSGL